MDLTFGEQMRVMMKRRGVSVQALADRLGVSRQNVNQRLNSEGLTEKEMQAYAAAIGCVVEIELKEPPGGAEKRERNKKPAGRSARMARKQAREEKPR